MRFVHPSKVEITERRNGGQCVMYTDCDGTQVCVEIARDTKVVRTKETDQKPVDSIVPPGGPGEPGTGLH